MDVRGQFVIDVASIGNLLFYHFRFQFSNVLLLMLALMLKK